ncbi:uncharacterized protein LOC124126053 [Haliotis rufescens]|uniref:uncharacterized protein LOC124126053 n=1 Tax=Haliotis rufescens TaxID=6454 RepID=UPI00201F66C2|nr:uncharacterized protein LOC124126053 [Haliotis rufescens]
MTPMWSRNWGNLCLAVYFLSVFSTCDTKQCELLKVDKLTPSSATIRNIGIKLCQVQTGPCASKTCSLNSRCLETRSGKGVCIDASNYPSEDPSQSESIPRPPVTAVKSDQHVTPTPESCRRLHVACCTRNLKEVKLFLSLGVNINCRWQIQSSRTPVMSAAAGGCGGVKVVAGFVVKFLVSIGADLSLMDRYGNNILFYACLGRSMRIMKFLLSLNVVDIDHRNQRGQTAADRARSVGFHRFADVLESRGEK